jgi:hypothetical protein
LAYHGHARDQRSLDVAHCDRRSSYQSIKIKALVHNEGNMERGMSVIKLFSRDAFKTLFIVMLSSSAIYWCIEFYVRFGFKFLATAVFVFSIVKFVLPYASVLWKAFRWLAKRDEREGELQTKLNEALTLLRDIDVRLKKLELSSQATDYSAEAG